MISFLSPPFASFTSAASVLPVASVASALPLGQSYLPIALMLLIAVGFALGTLVVSGWVMPTFFRKFKPSNPTPVKLEPYECGIPAQGDARANVFVRFYLVALLFLLFDMMTIFVLVWSLIFRGALGSPPALAFLMGEMAVFLGILAVGYVYAWRKGALTWH